MKVWITVEEDRRIRKPMIIIRILRAALLSTESNPFVQAAILLAVVYCVVAQWR